MMISYHVLHGRLIYRNTSGWQQQPGEIWSVGGDMMNRGFRVHKLENGECMIISYHFLLKLGYNLTQAGGSSGGEKFGMWEKMPRIAGSRRAHGDIIEKMVSERTRKW